jgi:hypothetical protein
VAELSGITEMGRDGRSHIQTETNTLRDEYIVRDRERDRERLLAAYNERTPAPRMMRIVRRGRLLSLSRAAGRRGPNRECACAREE